MVSIREAIVVEGRYDKNALAQIVDAPIFVTDGFRIFHDPQQLALLQRPDGSIGTVSIARTGLNAPIYEGTDTQAMIDGAGHWTGSSLGGGNVCLFGHNRGANPWFGELLDTEIGDTVVLETSAGTRTYRVSQVEQISSEDFTWLGSTGSSCITLISCVEGRPELRLMVRGEEVLPAETETVLQTTHD